MTGVQTCALPIYLDIITQRIKNFEYQLLKLLKVYKFTYNQNYVLSYQIKIINGKIRKLLAIVAINIGVSNGASNGIAKNSFDPFQLDTRFLVSKTQTPIENIKIAEILCETHKDVYGSYPSDNRLSLSWAQIALENNHGKKVWNYNLGNQGPFRIDQEYYYHKQKGWPYRSFKSFQESGRSYWQILNKCKSALRAFDDGDPKKAAISLKNCNYYGANVEEYTKILNSLY